MEKNTTLCSSDRHDGAFMRVVQKVRKRVGQKSFSVLSKSFHGKFQIVKVSPHTQFIKIEHFVDNSSFLLLSDDCHFLQVRKSGRGYQTINIHTTRQ